MPYYELYHGGPAGLVEIKPPVETGARCASDYGAAHVHDRRKVYLTRSFEDALVFACMAPAKAVSVYLVEPVGSIEPDPDCLVNGHSVCCERAKVIAERRVSRAQLRRFRRGFA